MTRDEEVQLVLGRRAEELRFTITSLHYLDEGGALKHGEAYASQFGHKAGRWRYALMSEDRALAPDCKRLSAEGISTLACGCCASVRLCACV